MTPLLLIAAGAAAVAYGIHRATGGGQSRGERLVAKIKTVLGLPYIWSGKSPARGFDCSGVVTWALEDLGFAPKGYSASHNTSALIKDAVSVSVPVVGDLVFYGPGGAVNHVMVYAGGGYAIGASGGGPETNTVDRAKEQDARVKIVRVDYRKDLIGYGRLPFMAG